MPLKVAIDHPTLELKPKIQTVCKDFLNTFGFSYFQYLRCYADGSVGLLTNDTNLFEYIQTVENSPVVASSFKNEHVNFHSYWFLWDEELPEAPVEIAREKFNIRNGITLVRRSKDYYDMIAVALPKEQPNPGSFYLNKLKGIEQFVHEFDKDNRALIDIMDKNPIALPQPYRDPNYKDICLTNGRVKVTGKLGITHITTQELACLRLLSQRASYKKIAQILEISPRTVESYLLRIKQRTGYTQRLDLERMIAQYLVF